MIVARNAKEISGFRDPVVALGVFDGVHRGHRSILRAVVRKAKKIKGTSMVLTFFPHPQKERSLYSLEHRLRLICELGVDVCVVINFSDSFAQMKAPDFIERVLVGRIHSRFIYVGENFRFGRGAAGDCSLLSLWSKKGGFKLKVFKSVKSGGNPVSSTLIRRLIRISNLRDAQRMLGRRVSVLGSVIGGSRIARGLGFPTANINPHHEIIPPRGIYAVQVVFKGKTYGGICYIGSRPTIPGGNKATRIEVHIFSFNRKIYGDLLEIQFLKFIRPDKKFASVKALSLQVHKDIETCRKILKSLS
jgi:riboflavin kinase/FMN adenylyltransferase